MDQNSTEPKTTNITTIDKLTDDHDNHKFRFEPPLYIQRYDFVIKLLKEYNCKTYLDIGCAEGKLLRFIKNSTVDLNLIVGLDQDQAVLDQSKDKYNNNLFDFLQTREEPLDMYIIKGDVSNPSPYFLKKLSHESINLDCVSLIEVIEHMYPDTLKSCIETVFDKLKPRMVVMSTPNSEFNVVFEDEEAKLGVNVSNEEKPNEIVKKICCKFRICCNFNIDS